MNKRILFITHHRRDRSPGQRFRFEQYLEYLQQNGFGVVFSNILDAKQDKVFYSQGHYLSKAGVVLSAALTRLNDVFRANDFDIIFVFREAFLTGTSVFEKLMARSRAKLVFDFDDSIWLDNVSDANRAFSFLKNAGKTAEIIRVCNLVFAGNPYLAAYARQHNPNTVVVPTTIDTTEYVPNESFRNTPGQVTIGWSGSITTIQHFNFAIPFLTELKRKYGNGIAIKVIGDGNYRNEKLGIVGLPWRKEDELAQLNSFDIGIMPLPDDEWARGKCGLKGLQYMALGVPTIMSPVGVNSDIIQDGANGFLASTPQEWLDKLTLLIEDTALRKKLGDAGRRTVVEKYSVDAWKDKYLQYFNELAAQPKQRK